MNRMQQQVRDFMLAMKQVIAEPGATPELRAAELRALLIKEEAKETVDAYEAKDLVEVLDGLCDILYVTFGAFEAIGVDAQVMFDEVHRTNMAKTDGPTDPVTGKKLKPPGWEPPRIATFIPIGRNARDESIKVAESLPQERDAAGRLRDDATNVLLEEAAASYPAAKPGDREIRMARRIRKLEEALLLGPQGESK